MLNLLAIAKFLKYFIPKRLQYFLKRLQRMIGDRRKEYGSCIFVFEVPFKARFLMHCDHWLLVISAEVGTGFICQSVNFEHLSAH